MAAVCSKWAKGTGGPAGDECQNLVAHALTAEGHDASEDGTGRGTPIVACAQNQRGELRTSEVMPALQCGGGKPGEGYPCVAIRTAQTGANGIGVAEDVAHTLDGAQGQAVAHGINGVSGTLRADPGSGFRSDGSYVEAVVTQGMAVRRLTPTECERLQGFPDGWTAVEGQPDSARYRQLGNAVCVPVAEWIGRRIVEVAA